MRLGGVVMAGLLLSTLPALADDLDGDWHGTLKTPTRGDLRMVFRFRHEGSTLKTQFISVDQAGASLPADTKLDDHHLVIDLPFGASFDGTLASDGKSIAGNFTQRGFPMALTLEPGTIDAPTVHQPDPGDLVVQTPTGTLAGTMIRKGPIGAVILNGSGSANRDGKSGDNGGRNTYQAIAQSLADKNISTLRYDKRGIGESAAAMKREDDITLTLMAADADAVAAELQHRLGTRCVWLIGHSEGGLVALAAAQDNPGICGLVLLASPGRPSDKILHEQLDRNLPAEDKPAAFAVLDNLAAGRPLGDVPPKLKSLFRPSLEAYWRSEEAVDPAALAAKLKIPVLILQGDADVQISLADAQALARARPDATLKIEAGVNHSQRVAKDDPGSGPMPLAPGLVDTIAGFIKAYP
jgi:pimeloyl-ACP methyl ester carboxylesterase